MAPPVCGTASTRLVCYAQVRKVLQGLLAQERVAEAHLLLGMLRQVGVICNHICNHICNLRSRDHGSHYDLGEGYL